MRMRVQVLATVILLLSLAAPGIVLAVPDIIRLHVVANSDSFEDQQVKEQVRDEIVAQLGPVFAELDQEEVAAWIMENKSAVQGIAQGVLEQAGCGYSARVKFGVTGYPTRLYGMAAYPAGKYKSLRVELGEGTGRNWWCIVFPPLCFVKETTEPKEDARDVVVKFWLWEKIISLFERIAGKRVGS
jgi:stage II sporulation protein R